MPNERKKAMANKWWFTKKNDRAEDFEDYNNDYYGDAAISTEAPENDGAYTTDTSDVSVVLSAPAKDEPLMKRTFTPATCNDSQEIVDAYKAGRVIVIYIEELDKTNFLRLFDYLMGAVQALDGSFDRIDRDTVVLFPYGVDPEETDVDALEEEVVEESDEQYEDEADNEDLD